MNKIKLMSVSLLLAFGMLFTGCGSQKTTVPDSSGVKSDEVQTDAPKAGDTIAVFHIADYGDVTVKLFPNAAPKAVENFTTHAKDGYYDGVLFHRVIDEFMIQGGDPLGNGTGGESIWGTAFEDEIVDNLLPIRGALCMANRGADTNGSQFFIVQAKSDNLDTVSTDSLSAEQIESFKENGGTPHLTGGYTVFGQVVDGMEVVDAIASVDTDANDKPLEDVVITNIEVKTVE